MKKSATPVVDVKEPVTDAVKKRLPQDSRRKVKEQSQEVPPQISFNPFSWMILYQQWMSQVIHKSGQLVIEWEGVQAGVHQQMEGPRNVKVSWHSYRGKTNHYYPKSINDAVLASSHVIQQMGHFEWSGLLNQTKDERFFEFEFEYLGETKAIGVWVEYQPSEKVFSMILCSMASNQLKKAA